MDKFLSSTIISRLLRYVRDGILLSIEYSRNLFCDLYQRVKREEQETCIFGIH